ncbi:MAG: hypothetical protein DMG62_00400 [Acidobacteria bacterium]|nr:MAG: hypothetical protein DMG62_00400 [Acidobacteriota bacterium]
MGPFFAPVISAATPARVPVCCRRNGAHHCSAVAEMLASGGDAFRTSNPCPMRQSQQLASLIVALPPSSTARTETARQVSIGRAVSRRHLKPIRLDHQRGPPALL